MSCRTIQYRLSLINSCVVIYSGYTFFSFSLNFLKKGEKITNTVTFCLRQAGKQLRKFRVLNSAMLIHVTQSKFHTP